MGTCNSSQPNQQRDQPQNRGSSTQITSSRSNGSRGSKTKTPILERSNLVQENTGSILKLYKIYPTVLGRGAFSEVRKSVQQSTGQARAIKIIKLHGEDSEAREQVFEELEIMKTLDHPYIAKVFEYFLAQSAFYLVMDLVEGKPLFEYMLENNVNITEAFVAEILEQILSALNYIHGQGILHRDIKNQNILFNGKHITLIDFGLSKFANRKSSSREIAFGTSMYLAPETIEGNYSEKSDVWSCGVLFYMLLTGEAPFKSGMDKGILESLKSAKCAIDPDKLFGPSTDAKDLVCKMLELSPKARPTAAECLKHPFLQTATRKVDVDGLRSIGENIKKFIYHTNLQEALYTYFVSLLMSKKEQEKLAEIFTSLDTNKDGVLSKEELKNGLYRGGHIYADAEFEELFNRLDVDGSGNISFSEYLLASFDKEQAFVDDDSVRKLFNLFDKVG